MRVSYQTNMVDRIEKIEWLDELEEWWILQKHYYFALCSKIKDQNEQTSFVKIVS